MSIDRRERMFCRIFALAATALMAGCGGGGASSPATPRVPGGPAGAQSVKVTVEIPSATASAKAVPGSARRKPATSSYIPLGGTKATVFVDNSPVPGVTMVPVGASYSFSTNVGSHNFTLTYYDNAANALSTGTATSTVTQAGPNNVTVLLGGIMKTVAFTALPAITIGTAIASAPVSVVGKDADGNTITGAVNYSNAITVVVSSAGAIGQVALSVNAGAPGSQIGITNPNDVVTLSYATTPATLGGCTFLTASAAGVPTVTSPSLIAGSSAPVPALAVTAPVSGFGRVGLSWTAYPGATSYKIYRGTAPGQESQLMGTAPGAATTFTDWWAYQGPLYYYRVSAVKAGIEYCDAAEPSNTATGDPTKLGAVQVWLDASDNSTITSAAPGHSPVQDGDTVFGWADKGGAANNAVQPGAASTQAQYQIAQFNGLPTMTGSGTQFWNFTSNPQTNGTWTVFTMASYQSGPQTPYDSFHRAPSLTIDNTPTANPDGVIPGPAIVPGTPTLLAHRGYSFTGFTNTTIYVNGNAVPAVNSVIPGGTFPATFQQAGPTNLSLWRFQDPIPPTFTTFMPKQYFQGNMSEWIAYSAYLPVASQQKVEGYLAWKWGLSSLLVPGHPYKAAPP